MPGPRQLNALQRRLLNEFQQDLPLTPRPYADMARVLGSTEEEVIGSLSDLAARGYVSRIGPVFTPHRIGCSVLAALAVPASDVDAVAALVNSYPEVNHNYEREHSYNLWFVVTGENPAQVERVVLDIEARSAHQVLRLPLERAYHIDLGFPLWS